jgi:predicted Zn-dependent protease
MSHDRERSAWTARAANHLAQLSPAALDQEVALRLGWQARRLDLPAGRYQVVLPPECVADLMVCLYVAGDARTAAGGRGPFARASGGTRVGDRVSEMPLRLRSDPAEPGLECAPAVLATAPSAIASVMDNGLPLTRQEWISDGIVRGLHSTRDSARVASAPLRPAPGNLILESTGSTAGGAEELAANLDRGLLATSLWFVQETDPDELLLTGVLRDGLYVIDGGEVVGVLADRRFVESPLQMLDRVVEVGGTRRALGRDWGASFSRTAMPALRVDGFEIADASRPGPGVR